MYVLTNINIAGNNSFMTKHVVVLPIMDMEVAKSDKNGRKEEVCFFAPWY